LRAARDDYQTAWGLHNLGHAVEYQGDYRRAAALFEESLGLFEQMASPLGVAACLTGLAAAESGPVTTRRGGKSKEGGLERLYHAARLFGAAQALMDSIGRHLELADKADYERNQAAVRSRLPEASFASAWAEGQAMTVEQAIAYARIQPQAGPDVQAAPVASASVTPPEVVPKPPFFGLTAREREVAALVGQGLSNRAIADALVVSERTVETHVGHILGKLGFETRGQVAAWVAERGLRLRYTSLIA
jgi:non-specific serine/threonine protein kinase